MLCTLLKTQPEPRKNIPKNIFASLLVTSHSQLQRVGRTDWGGCVFSALPMETILDRLQEKDHVTSSKPAIYLDLAHVGLTYAEENHQEGFSGVAQRVCLNVPHLIPKYQNGDYGIQTKS